MTAQLNQSMKVYIADFSKCGTKASFYRMISHAFGLNLSATFMDSTKFWRTFCEFIAGLTLCGVQVKVRISGLENVYSFFPEGVDKFLRILRAAEDRSSLFITDIKIGNAIWHCR